MAGSMTDYLENKLLDHVFGKAAYTMPSTVYVALYTGAPSETGNVNELAGGGYSRQPVSMGSAVNGTITNNAPVTFPIATSNWNIVGVGILDAQGAGAGNLLWGGTLDQAEAITTGNQFVLPIGFATFTLD